MKSRFDVFKETPQLDSNSNEFSQYTHENGVVDHIKKMHDYGNQDMWNVKRNSIIWV